MSLVIGNNLTIEPGITITTDYSVITDNLVLNLDAGNVTSYPGSGSTWTDLISARTFTLYGSPTYNSGNGGSLEFNTTGPSSQYALCTSSLPSLTDWTVEAWHYYTNTNSSGSPCIVVQQYIGNINYCLGSTADNSPILQAAFFSGGWQATASNYSLTSGNWYQVVGTCNNSTVNLYINGTLVRTYTWSGSPPSAGAGGIFLMHRWDNNDVWGGNLSIVRIYDTDIGSAGVNQNWNANKSRFGL